MSEELGLSKGGDERLRKVFSWTVVISASLFAIFCIVVVLHTSIKSDKIGKILESHFEQHFSAVVGVPLAAVAAMFIVLVLKVTEGPIEFEGLTFKFKGASGEIVLWLMCFLGISTAIKLCW